MSEDNDPLYTDAREDSGAQTYRKYTYQAAYGVVLLVGAASRKRDYDYLVCEHHEDFLAHRKDGKYDAFQIKTRKRENGAWEVGSEPLCKAVSRFVLLEAAFASSIATYSFVSNAGFLDSSSKTTGPKSPVALVEAVASATDRSKLPDVAQTALSRLITKIPGVNEDNLWGVLKKLNLITSLQEENLYPELCQTHVATLSWCQLNPDKLREVAIQLVTWVGIASSDLTEAPEVHFPRDDPSASPAPRIAARVITVGDFVARSKLIAEQTAASFPASSPQIGSNPASQSSTAAPSAALVADLSEAQDSLIDEALALIRKGQHREANRRLQAIRTSTSWANLLGTTRVRTLRLLATIAVQFRGDASSAKSLLLEASSEPGNHRLNLEQALVLVAERELQDAAELLSSPASPQEHHLASAIVLQKDGPQAAEAHLESSSFEKGPETLRLLAICSIAARDIQQATQRIESALEQAPDWHLVQETAGAIYFLRTLPSAWPNWGLLDWPIPPPKEFVLSTSDARESLAKAQRTLGSLTQHFKDVADRSLRLETWHLASLALDPERTQDASAVACGILESDPTCIQALVWTLEFSLDVPIAPIIRALEARLDNSIQSLDYRDALLHIACINGEWQRAFDLIEEHRELYAQASHEEPWLLHATQLLTALGQHDDCVALIATIESQEQQLRLRCATARIKAKNSGWTEDLARLPFDLYRLTGNPSDLAAAIEASFFAGDYEFVTDHVTELLEKLPTPFYLRLGLTAAQRQSRFADGLQLLSNAPRIFGSASLPPDVAQKEIDCLLHEGQYLKAAIAAKKLTEATDDRSVWLQLFQVQLRSGDATGALSTARAILQRGDAQSNELVHLAERVRADNPELARDLLREASKLGLDEGKVAAAAAFMTFALGLESELSDVVKKVLSIPEASDGVVHAVPLPELVERIQESNAGGQNLERAYRRAEAPLHLILSQSRAPLAHVIGREFARPQSQSSDLHYRRSLHLFNGRNRDHIQRKQLDRPCSLLLDPTSLLVLEKLSLLSVVEGSYNPLVLPPSIFDWFAHELAEINGYQDSRQQSIGDVLRLAAAGNLQPLVVQDTEAPRSPPTEIDSDWLAAATKAQQEGWLLIDHLPLISRGNWEVVAVPTEFSNIVYTPVELLEALQSEAYISKGTYNDAVDKVGSSPSSEPRTTSLSNATGVILSPGVATTLANAGLLQPTCDATVVYLLDSEIRSLHIESSSFAHRSETAASLQRLRDHVHQKLKEGVYTIAPVTTREDNPPIDPLTTCVQEWLSLKRDTAEFILADDRFFQSFDTAGEDTPIISTCDLIASLNRRGILTAEAAIQQRQKLRFKGIRYVRLSGGDLYHFLRAALSPDGDFRESTELASLRRYYASCLNDAENLRHPSGAPEDVMKRSELLFVTHLIHASSNALVDVWQDVSTPDDAKVAMSDWLIASLWVGFPMITELVPCAGQNNAHLEGMSESHLALAGLQLDDNVPAGPSTDESAAKKFYSWLFSRLGTERRQLDTFILRLKESVFSLSGYGKSEAERRVANFLSLRAIEQMPPVIRDAMNLTEEEIKACGVTNAFPICFADLRFDNESFWESAKAANESGEPQPLADISDPPVPVELSVTGDALSPLQLQVQHGSGQNYVLSGPEIALLKTRCQLNSVEKTRMAQALDLDPDASDSFLDDLYQDHSDVARRIGHFRDRQDTSSTGQIDRLKNRLRDEHSFSLDDVEPVSFEHIISHVRVPLPVIPSSIADAADEIIEHLDLAEALRRLSHLPFDPPATVRDQFLQLTPSERAESLRSLGPIERQPTRLHFVASVLASGDEACRETATNLLASAMEQDTFIYHKLFRAILRWSQSRVLENHDPFDLDPSTLFIAAWLHASRVHAVMVGTPNPDELLSFYGQHESQNLDLALRFREDIDLSALNAKHFSPAVFLSALVLRSLPDLQTPDTQREHLVTPLQKLMFPYETENVPAIDLLTMRSSFSPGMGAQLYEIPGGSVREFPELPDDSFLEDAQIDGRIAHLLTRIADGEDLVESWMLLNLHVQTFPLQYAQKPMLEEAMANFGPEPFDGRLPAFLSAMLFQFVQCKHFSNLDFDFLYQRLCVFRSGLALLAPDLSVHERANHLVHAASLLAERSDDLADNTRLLARLILAICNHEPEHSAYLLDALASLTRRLPVSAQKDLSFALFKLREWTRRIELRSDPSGADIDRDGANEST